MAITPLRKKKNHLWKFFVQAKKPKPGKKISLRSDHDKSTWEIGVERTHDGYVQKCHGGFHASRRIWQAEHYVWSDVLGLVSVKGESDLGDDKESWEKMTVDAVWILDDKIKRKIGKALLKEFPTVSFDFNKDALRPNIKIGRKFSVFHHSTPFDKQSVKIQKCIEKIILSTKPSNKLFK